MGNLSDGGRGCVKVNECLLHDALNKTKKTK